MVSCDQSFYSIPRILRRVWENFWQRRQPLITLVGSLSYRVNLRLNYKAYTDLKLKRGGSWREGCHLTRCAEMRAPPDGQELLQQSD